MPLYNFNTDSVQWQEEDIDFCIIGAGAAGILLAIRLSDAGHKILLLESGHMVEDPDRQRMNEVVHAGKKMNSAEWGRKRAIGGTTIAWGGQSLPFSPIDFEKRIWVQNSGWPFGIDELSPYYKSANHFMGIDSLDYLEDVFNLFKMKPIAFDQEKIYNHFSKWAPEPNFKKLYEKKLTSQVSVVYNAHLTRIDILDNGGRYQLEIQNFQNIKKVLTVPNLILATGGIETSRILLSNNHQVKEGIGNHSGWLGKCFMEHPCINAGELKPICSSFELQKKFSTRIKNGIKYSSRLTLIEKVQREQKLLGGSASIMFITPNESFDPYAEIRHFLNTKSFKSAIKILSNASHLASSVQAIAVNNFIYRSGAVPQLTLMLEQEPIKDSCITLSEEKDQFSVPKAKINWKISPATWETAISLTYFCKQELARLGFGDLQVSSRLTADNQSWEDALSDVNHHMGGARMSSTPTEGVVDPYCRVWGLNNLFVCSTAVYPTSSFSNPTLTLLALGERMVRHFGSSKHSNASFEAH